MRYFVFKNSMLCPVVIMDDKIYSYIRPSWTINKQPDVTNVLKIWLLHFGIIEVNAKYFKLNGIPECDISDLR